MVVLVNCVRKLYRIIKRFQSESRYTGIIGLIVARSKNNVIGKNGEIPWKKKGEQKQFKELTTGNVVVMGRKSFDEIGHPLPNRENIVVSRSKRYEGDNLYTAKSVPNYFLNGTD